MRESALEHIKNFPIIPVYYHENPDTCIQVLKACYEGGIRVFEFTNRGPAAVDNFRELLKCRNTYFPDLKLGIGTIKTVTQCTEYINIGTDFIVSPIVKEDLAKLASEKNVLWIPGCMTPTEINLAEELGAPLVKLFPGDSLGPGFLKAIKPLFPSLKFMPTGGVDTTKENIDKWLEAGVTALGFGSKLFQAPENSANFQWLTQRCQELFRLVNKN